MEASTPDKRVENCAAGGKFRSLKVEKFVTLGSQLESACTSPH